MTSPKSFAELNLMPRIGERVWIVDRSRCIDATASNTHRGTFKGEGCLSLGATTYQVETLSGIFCATLESIYPGEHCPLFLPPSFQFPPIDCYPAQQALRSRRVSESELKPSPESFAIGFSPEEVASRVQSLQRSIERLQRFQILCQTLLNRVPCTASFLDRSCQGVAIAELRLKTGNVVHSQFSSLILVELPDAIDASSGEADRCWLPADQVTLQNL